MVPVFVLWSAPRARSTAFFRSMAERGDVLALHEPLEGLVFLGPVDVDGLRFESAPALLAWLRDGTGDRQVFVKETWMEPKVADLVLADRRFLAGARHALLIRRPEEIAASFHAIDPGAMTVDTVGLEGLEQLHDAVVDAGGRPPVVLDSDDLVSRPEATMAAYCDAMGLPFLPHALRWAPGDRPEWERTARWHRDAASSSGFVRREQRYAETVETSARLAGYAAHHRPAYERLHARRLDVSAYEQAQGIDPQRGQPPP